MKVCKLVSAISVFAGLKHKQFNPAKLMLFGYLFVILAGTTLLMLPISHQMGTDVRLVTALFTATSATSVTGLVVVDTAQTWSLFGRIVILCLIQIGALGFMSFITIFFFIMNKKIGLSQRLLIIQSLNLNDMRGVVKLIRHVLMGTLIFQGTGTVLLCIRFIPRHGLLHGFGMGAFHSVAAFANAGFDLFGYNIPLHGLTDHAQDGLVVTVVMVLAFIGGLGFFVWEDIWQNRFRLKQLHIHSKLVLHISFWLILLGWIFFFAAERNNPHTIGDMSLPNALHISLFQVIMPRSAGFSVIGQGELVGATKMVVMILMLIGGSPGSMAGGIKNVTVGILFLSAVNYFKGRNTVVVFGRTIPTSQVKSALTISITVLCAVVFGSLTIALIQPEIPFAAILFETISAITTCGLSYGITGTLAPVSQVILILFMFCGRVGIMTLGMVAFLERNKNERIKHPETWIMMG
jgi:trk system potassium uptake protein TrkH